MKLQHVLLLLCLVGCGKSNYNETEKAITAVEQSLEKLLEVEVTPDNKMLLSTMHTKEHRQTVNVGFLEISARIRWEFDAGIITQKQAEHLSERLAIVWRKYQNFVKSIDN